MTRIGRIIQDNSPARRESFWPLDVTMVILGGVLLWIVANYLRFNDNRWQYNAWTYLLAVPTVLTILSALLRFFVGKFVERSMQVAFLLSVTVHLVLLLAAVNVVIFAKWWPDVYEAISQQVTREQVAKQYLTTAYAKSVTGSAASRPDYLKPVQTQHEASEEDLTADGAMQLAANERADLPTLQPDESRQQNVQASIVEKAEIIPTAASSELRMADLSRAIPQVSRPQTAPISVPEVAAKKVEASETSESISEVGSALDRPENTAERSPIQTPQAFEIPQSTDAKAMTKGDIASKLQPPRPTTQQLPKIEMPEANLELQKSTAVSNPVSRSRVPRITLPDRPATSTAEPSPAPRIADLAEAMVATEATRSAATAASNTSNTAELPNTSSASAVDFRQSQPAGSLPQRNTELAVTTPSGSKGNPTLRLNKAAPDMPRRMGGNLGPVTSPLNSKTETTDASENNRLDSLADISPVSRSNAGDTNTGNGAGGSVSSPDQLSGPENSSLAMVDSSSEKSAGLPFQRRGLNAFAENNLGDSGGMSASPLSLGKQLAGPIIRRPGSDKKIEIPKNAGGANPSATQSPSGAEKSEKDNGGTSINSSDSLVAEAALDQFSDIQKQVTSTSAAERPLELEAIEGLGGLLKDAENGSRLTERKALQPLNVPQELVTQRFIRDLAGAPSAMGSSVPIPRPAFQQRIDRMKQNGDLSESGGPAGPQTEESIELGLAFLARSQRQDGRWRLQDFDTEVLIRSDTAATALSVLAFQGAGYTHRQFKYAPVVGKAISFLIKNQKPDGDLYLPQDPASDQNGWLYSHSIASLALCEAYGMTQDPMLKEPAQKAVAFMVASQDPQRGGWRYRPGRGTDTSVTGWFMMALQSAQLAGLEVPESTRTGIRNWIVASKGEGEQAFLYRYNPNAADTPSQRHGLVPNPTMTSVGLLMSLYTGEKRDKDEVMRGANYLLDYLPSEGNEEQSLRDTYYWYYSTQVMFHMGGNYWEKWNSNLYPMLVRTQVKEGEMAGSWNPLGEVPDLWGKYGGRLYVTTMNLLSLEVNYRHLPLYEATGK